MLAGGIRTIAVICSLFVVASFTLFAIVEMDGASRVQQAAVYEGTPAQEDRRESERSGPREALDDVNDELLRPFAGVVVSDNAWVQRGVPTLLALLIYGAGLGFLARYVGSRA